MADYAEIMRELPNSGEMMHSFWGQEVHLSRDELLARIAIRRAWEVVAQSSDPADASRGSNPSTLLIRINNAEDIRSLDRTSGVISANSQTASGWSRYGSWWRVQSDADYRKDVLFAALAD